MNMTARHQWELSMRWINLDRFNALVVMITMATQQKACSLPLWALLYSCLVSVYLLSLPRVTSSDVSMQKRLSLPRFAISDLWGHLKLHPCSKRYGTFLKSDMMVVACCEEEKSCKWEINIAVYFGWTEFLDEAMFQKLFHDLEITCLFSGMLVSSNMTFNVNFAAKCEAAEMISTYKGEAGLPGQKPVDYWPHLHSSTSNEVSNPVLLEGVAGAWAAPNPDPELTRDQISPFTVLQNGFSRYFRE